MLEFWCVVGIRYVCALSVVRRDKKLKSVQLTISLLGIVGRGLQTVGKLEGHNMGNTEEYIERGQVT